MVVTVVVRERTPYAQIDPPVRQLCRVLNRFPGICTYTSCGGHPGPHGDNQCRVDEGHWYVDWHVDRSDEALVSLEFQAWIAGDIAPLGIELCAFAKAPYLNFPGRMLFYRWAGFDPDEPKATADNFAQLLTEHRRDYFMTAAAARRLDATCACGDSRHGEAWRSA